MGRSQVPCILARPLKRVGLRPFLAEQQSDRCEIATLDHRPDVQPFAGEHIGQSTDDVQGDVPADELRVHVHEIRRLDRPCEPTRDSKAIGGEEFDPKHAGRDLQIASGHDQTEVEAGHVGRIGDPAVRIQHDVAVGQFDRRESDVQVVAIADDPSAAAEAFGADQLDAEDIVQVFEITAAQVETDVEPPASAADRRSRRGRPP